MKVLTQDHLSLGLGQANRIGAEVEDAVPLSQEDGPQDNERSSRWRKIGTHKGTDAMIMVVEDVILWLDGEVMSAESEAYIWERLSFLALDGVLAVGVSRGTHLLITGKCQSDSARSGSRA